MVEISLLRSLPLFAPLGAPELAGLAHGLAESHVAAGGDGFGELALLRDVPRTAAVTARTDCRLYALGKACFLASTAAHPRASGEAERLVGEHLPAQQATIAP